MTGWNRFLFRLRGAGMNILYEVFSIFFSFPDELSVFKNFYNNLLAHLVTCLFSIRTLVYTVSSIFKHHLIFIFQTLTSVLIYLFSFMFRQEENTFSAKHLVLKTNCLFYCLLLKVLSIEKAKTFLLLLTPL